MSCSRLELGLGDGLKALPLCHCERDGKAGGRALVELSALPHAQFPRISGHGGRDLDWACIASFSPKMAGCCPGCSNSNRLMDWPLC